MNHCQMMKKLKSKTWFTYWTGNLILFASITTSYTWLRFTSVPSIFPTEINSIFCQVLYLTRGLSWNVPSSWWKGSFQIISSWRMPDIPRQFVGHSEVTRESTRSRVVFQTTIEAATSETCKIFKVIHKLFQAMTILAKETIKDFKPFLHYLKFHCSHKI